MEALGPVQRPKFDQPVCFVRRDGDDLLWTLATLYRDGSCCFCYPEPSPRSNGEVDWTQMSCGVALDNWERTVATLVQCGFVELPEAKLAGWVPEGWQPPETLIGCGQVSLVGTNEHGQQPRPLSGL